MLELQVLSLFFPLERKVFQAAAAVAEEVVATALVIAAAQPLSLCATLKIFSKTIFKSRNQTGSVCCKEQNRFHLISYFFKEKNLYFLFF